MKQLDDVPASKTVIQKIRNSLIAWSLIVTDSIWNQSLYVVILCKWCDKKIKHDFTAS